MDFFNILIVALMSILGIGSTVLIVGYMIVIIVQKTYRKIRYGIPFSKQQLLPAGSCYVLIPCKNSGNMIHYISEIMERSALCRTLHFIESSVRLHLKE